MGLSPTTALPPAHEHSSLTAALSLGGQGYFTVPSNTHRGTSFVATMEYEATWSESLTASKHLRR